MDRPPLGTIPAATASDDERYLDFTEGLRVFVPSIDRGMKPYTDQALADYEARTGRKPDSAYESKEALDHLHGIRAHKKFMRVSQEMFWKRVEETYRAREPELLAELDAADRMGPGSVDYDPAFLVPDYARREIHLQPGGYTDDPLAGYIFHLGTKVFYVGANDHDEIQAANVNAIPGPADGRVARVLEIACSIGQSATFLKDRYPQADVWGIDVSMPMVRYAHKRAVEMGTEVHFAQRLAEATGFPAASFDLIYSFLIFHEVPLDVREQIVAEMARIVRPGGAFVASDFPTSGKFFRGPLSEVFLYTDAIDNCEPYEWEFMNSDFVSMLKRYFGSVEVKEEHLGQWKFGMPFYVCSNP